jgi:hypothetical protein
MVYRPLKIIEPDYLDPLSQPRYAKQYENSSWALRLRH